MCEPIKCIATISKQVTKITLNISEYFTVYLQVKRHMNTPSCKDQVPLGSPAWAGGIGSDDLQRLPPTSILLRFCDCYGITSLFVQMNGCINSNSSGDLNTLNHYQISKVKKLGCPVLPVLGCVVGCTCRICMYIHLWKIYTIHAYTYICVYTHTHMTLGKRRWSKASPEMPKWPLQSYTFFNASFCSARNFYTQRYCFAFKIILTVSNQLNWNNTENTRLKIG